MPAKATATIEAAAVVLFNHQVPLKAVLLRAKLSTLRTLATVAWLPRTMLVGAAVNILLRVGNSRCKIAAGDTAEAARDRICCSDQLADSKWPISAAQRPNRAPFDT